ncbi:phage integrase N-terminal SAM-like domain-containing protein [bacterium]|nr:phage integrase N-terminal SAM-like domain-containing protein [bacterium]
MFKRYSLKTNEAYINAVKGLAYFHNQSPDKLTDEQIQEYKAKCPFGESV